MLAYLCLYQVFLVMKDLIHNKVHLELLALTLTAQQTQSVKGFDI